jgi:hypothetical protein
MGVTLVAVRSRQAQKARSEYGKPGGDNKVDHDFYPWCEARGGAGLWFVVAAIYGGSEEMVWREAYGLDALCGGHGR